MRISLSRLGTMALALALVVGVTFAALPRPVAAQDAMAKVVCDSDLILSKYIAEYYFGFAAVIDGMMADSSMSSMVTIDLAAYDDGQFTPLFESMMGMMSDDMAMPDMAMSDDMMDMVMQGMSMDMSMMDSMMMEATPEADGAMMTALVPPVVAGEPAECTALRDTLRHFYTSVAYANMASMMMGEGQ